MYKLKKNKHFYKLFAIFIFLLQCVAKRFIPEHVTTAPPAIAAEGDGLLQKMNAGRNRRGGGHRDK